jgi:hypothetical protein
MSDIGGDAGGAATSAQQRLNGVLIVTDTLARLDADIKVDAVYVTRLLKSSDGGGAIASTLSSPFATAGGSKKQ